MGSIDALTLELLVPVKFENCTFVVGNIVDIARGDGEAQGTSERGKVIKVEGDGVTTMIAPWGRDIVVEERRLGSLYS